jgi:hypothetical protein
MSSKVKVPESWLRGFKSNVLIGFDASRSGSRTGGLFSVSDFGFFQKAKDGIITECRLRSEWTKIKSGVQCCNQSSEFTPLHIPLLRSRLLSQTGYT